MADSVRARLRRGLGGHAFGQAVALLVQFANVPLFLHFWGAGLYGEWLVLAAFPAYLTISNLGFTTATSHEITMRVARGDTDEALAAFQTTWVLITVLSILAAAAIVGGASQAPLARWFDFAALDDRAATLVLGLLVFQVLVNIQTGLVAVGLVSAGQYGLHVFLAALTRLCAFVLVVAVLAGGGGPLGAAMAMAGTECAGFLAIAYHARRFSPWLRYGGARASRDVVRRLVGPSFGFLLFIVGNAIQIQGPVIVIGAILGPTAVAVFSSLRMLARVVVMLGNVVFNSVRPEVAMAFGVGDTALMRRLNNRVIQFAVWMAGIAFLALMVLGPPVVELWTVGRIHAEQPLFALLVAAGMGTLTWTGAATALYATNNNRAIATAYVAIAAIGVAGSVAGVHLIGLAGAGLALFLAELAVLVAVLVRTLRFLDQGIGELCAAIARPPTDFLSVLRRER